MNPISTINNYVINHFKNDDLVKTVSLVKTIEIDTNISNIYMLVNVDMIESPIDEQTISINFLITALQQRDTYNKKTDSKLLEDTNYIDNMAETHFVLTRFLNVLRQQNNDDNIEVLSVSTPRSLRQWNRSNLDGWQMNIELQIPNLIPSC